jgi:hypothetical protein
MIFTKNCYVGLVLVLMLPAVVFAGPIPPLFPPNSAPGLLPRRFCRSSRPSPSRPRSRLTLPFLPRHTSVASDIISINSNQGQRRQGARPMPRPRRRCRPEIPP